MSVPHTPSLEDRAIRGAFWSAIERLGPQAVQLIVSIVLARLLLPKDFGLIGMLTIFFALGQVLLVSGFGPALIQKQDATEIHYCSVFYLNTFLGLAAAGTLCLVAPWIARFYGQPALAPLTRLLSLNFIVTSLGLVHVTLMRKRLDFRTQTKVSLLASLGSGAVGVGMALGGFGVWSLAAQNLSLTCFSTALLWAFSSWRPQTIFSLAALRDLLRFASRLLVSNVLDAVVPNLATVVIGKLVSPTDLGYYTRANLLQQLPSQTMGEVVRRVAFPVFSQIQDDQSRVRNGFRRVLGAVGLIHFPLMTGIMVCAGPLVLTLLTEKWAPAIPYLRLLSMVGLLYPLHMMNLNVLLAHGHSDLLYRTQLINNLLMVMNLAVTWRCGIQAIIVGQIVLSVVAYLLSSHYSGVVVGYGTKSQVSDLWPYLIAASIMGTVLHVFTWLPISHPSVLLAIQVAAGVLIYPLLCRAFRLSAFVDAWQTLQGRIVALRGV